jgi:hypothetical protein
VIRDALALADKEDRMADSLVWIRDQAIFFAQHAEAVKTLRQAIEDGVPADAAERAAIRAARTTHPVGGPAIAVLHVVGGRG